MFKLKQLKKGSKIAIINISSGLNQVFPWIYDSGRNVLEENFGFEVVEMESAQMTSHELYLEPRRRAESIHKAFLDPTIDGIITSIGGDDSNRMLPFIDPQIIVNNPKMIMGFSDASTLLTYFNQLGMVTLHGPSVMAGFAQMATAPDGYIENIEEVFFGHYPLKYRSYDKICHTFRDWTDQKNKDKCGPFEAYTGLKVIHGEALLEGQVWGGCVEVLEFTKGTDYWPKKTFFKDKILLFETSEEHPSPEQVRYYIRNYGLQGIFDLIKGMVISVPREYTEEERENLKVYLLDMMQIEFPGRNITIIMNGNFGHTYPIDILPFGTRVRFDAINNEVTLLESPFEVKT